MTTASEFALACATVAGAGLVLWVAMEACGRILDRLFDRQLAAGLGGCEACTCECALIEARK